MRTRKNCLTEEAIAWVISETRQVILAKSTSCLGKLLFQLDTEKKERKKERKKRREREREGKREKQIRRGNPEKI